MTLIGGSGVQLQHTTIYTIHNSKRFYSDWDIYIWPLLASMLTIASSYILYKAQHELGSAVD